VSVYNTYNTIIEMKLANSSETFYTSAMKLEAVNATLEQLYKDYALPENTITANITFDSNGISAKPSDYYRMVKLWKPGSSGSITAFADAGSGSVTVTSASHGLSDDEKIEISGTTSYNGIFTVDNVTTDTFTIVDTWVADDATGSWTEGVEKNAYQYLPASEFDSKDTGESYWWTIDYITGEGSRKLKVVPIDSGVLRTRYVIAPVAIDSVDSIDSGLGSEWDEPVAYGACMRLFQNSNRWDEAREWERLYKKTTAETALKQQNPGGFKSRKRFRSAWETRSYLNR